MRGRFWIPTAALLALGLVFYFAVYGFRFAGVLLFLAAGVVLAFGIVDALRGRFPRFSRWAPGSSPSRGGHFCISHVLREMPIPSHNT